MRLRSASLLSTALLLLARGARADDDAPISIVVSGSSSSSFSSKAKEGERPRETGDAAALLEGLPGLHVRRLGAEGGFATVSIRGAASNQVAVTLASVPLTGAADPSIDLATLPLWPGALVRVHRTFAPAHLGGGYLGGVVQIDPVDKASGAHTEVYDAIGSFGAARLRIADVRPIGEHVQIASGLSASRADNDFEYFDWRTQTERDRRNAGLAQVAGLVQARIDGAWNVVLTALGQTRRDGVGGAFVRPMLFTRIFRDRELFALEARKGDEDGRFLITTWLRRDARAFDDPMGEQTFVTGTSHDRVLAAGGSLGRSFKLDRLTLDVRLAPTFETSRATQILVPSPIDHRRSALGASLDASLEVNDALVLALAARADFRRDEGDGGEDSEVLPSGHLGFEYAFAEGTTIAGHFGALARPPSFLELLGDGGVYKPSPNLGSERALSADFGVRFVEASGKVRRELELVAFASRTRDLIVVRSQGLASLRAENVGDAFAAGIELATAVSAGPVRASGSYTLLYTEDRTNNPVSNGNPLPGRPMHDVTLDLSLRIRPITLRYGIDIVSSTILDPAGTLELPRRAWHTAGVRWDVFRGLSLVGEVINVFDQRTISVVAESISATYTRYPVSDFIGYPIPGRRFSLSLRYTL